MAVEQKVIVTKLEILRCKLQKVKGFKIKMINSVKRLQCNGYSGFSPLIFSAFIIF